MKTEEKPKFKKAEPRGVTFGEWAAILTVLFLIYAVFHDIVCKYAH
ncbi:MAG: hypothetical protein WCW78_01105 [Candidatus Paceibacterota bacterium]|jgi:hypothetical protein